MSKTYTREHLPILDAVIAVRALVLYMYNMDKFAITEDVYHDPALGYATEKVETMKKDFLLWAGELDSSHIGTLVLVAYNRYGGQAAVEMGRMKEWLETEGILRSETG